MRTGLLVALAVALVGSGPASATCHENCPPAPRVPAESVTVIAEVLDHTVVAQVGTENHYCDAGDDPDRVLVQIGLENSYCAETE